VWTFSSVRVELKKHKISGTTILRRFAQKSQNPWYYFFAPVCGVFDIAKNHKISGTKNSNEEAFFRVCSHLEMPKHTKKGKRAAALSRTRAGSQQAKTDSARANAAVEVVLPACITAALPPEILVYVLCRFEDGTKSVAKLSQGAATSKHWLATVKLVLANEVWCAAHVVAGEAFVLKLPEFLANATIGPITNDGLTKSCRDFPREMRAFAASKPVQIAAIPTLISIAACATRTIYFGKSLACVLVHVMQAQPHDEEVQQRACEGICTVSPLYQEQLLDAGAVPVMVKADPHTACRGWCTR